MLFIAAGVELLAHQRAGLEVTDLVVVSVARRVALFENLLAAGGGAARFGCVRVPIAAVCWRAAGGLAEGRSQVEEALSKLLENQSARQSKPIAATPETSSADARMPKPTPEK